MTTPRRRRSGTSRREAALLGRRAGAAFTGSEATTPMNAPAVRLVDIGEDVITFDTWIPMPDGARLHTRIWLPAASADPEADGFHPAPALLEYLPYRLDDWTSVRDSERHPYYAAHGYASVRVDIRGSGSSDGIFDDEYSEQELDDGEQVIAWLAAQPWCTGAVGIFGISWGGFNALQLAERAPEALRAVVTVCSTDDRYDNDVHYMGGALLGIDMGAWAGTMLAHVNRPPRPEVVGASWIERWRERLEGARPMAPIWMSHQERDDYWRRGSVCENYPGISAAVLAVGGWADPYHDTVFRLLEHLKGPRKGLLGPWAHQYPDRTLTPGPQIGFLAETLRWWDRWLRGIDTGVESDPDLKVWINESQEPTPYVPERIGGWIGVRTWPDSTEPSVHPLSPEADEAREMLPGPESASAWGAQRIVRSPLDTGSEAGRFFPFGNRADLPPDQRADDGRSVCIDLPVGDEPLTILGHPVVHLRVAADTTRGNVIVRICDVAPDGTSALVTRGVLNLARRKGTDRADDMVPGQWEDVTIRLVSAGHRFSAGHVLRVAISDHYWPWIWPHELPGALRVDLAASRVELPGLPTVTEPVSFSAPEHARPIPVGPPRVQTLREASKPFDDHPDWGPVAPETDLDGALLSERVVEHDVERAHTVLSVDPRYGGTKAYPDGVECVENVRETYEIARGDVLSGRATARWDVYYEADQWAARLQTLTQIRTEPGEFVIDNALRGHARRELGQPWELVAERRWVDRVPRSSV